VSDRDFAEGLDGMQADMAAHQRRFKGEVTASSNQTLAAEAMQQIERQLADAKPAPAPAAPEPIERTTTKHDGANGRYLVERGPDAPMKLRTASKMEHEWFVRAMPRVELLLSKLETGPLGQASWNQRTMHVLKFMQDSIAHRQAGRYETAAHLHARYVFELEQLLDASSAAFGDWRADPATKIVMAV